MNKKVLSVILSLIMVLTLLPLNFIQVNAAEIHSTLGRYWNGKDFPIFPSVSQNHYVIYTEGSRDNRLEMVVFNSTSDNVNIVWDGSLHLNKNENYKDDCKFYYDTSAHKWIEFETNYHRISDNATMAFVSNLDIYRNGKLFVKGMQYAENSYNKIINSDEVFLEYFDIIDKGQYDGNEGDSFVYTIGMNQYSRGNEGIDGRFYEHGLEAWIARWNYTEELSWAYATFDIGGKFDFLKGNINLLKSYNTTNFDSTLFICDGDKTLKEYHLTPNNLPQTIDVNITGVKNLKIRVKDNKAVAGGTAFGLTDLKVYKSDEIIVKLNGKKIEFDQKPVIIDGRTLVPLRAIFEELGATVDWDGTTQTVTSTKGQTTISMSIGKTEMYKNGKLITLDVVPQLVGGRTLVPVRAVAEGFDCVVEWLGETQTVVITTVNKDAVIKTAKSLYEANEALGGVTNLASYAEVDALLYNTMNDIDVTIGWNDFTLDMVSAGTTATIAAAKASMGNYSSVNSLGDGVKMLLSSSDIADAADGVLKDAVKQKITDKISSSVPDIEAFVLGLGRDAYDNNSKMILDLMEVHMKFKNNTYTYDDAVAYIVLYDTIAMNRKTMSMAVQVLSDELPANFLESLSMSAGAAAKSVLGSLFGEVFSGRNMNVGAELFTDIITAYTDYACGEGVDFFRYMKQINHPAINEWVNEVEVYNSNLAQKLNIHG